MILSFSHNNTKTKKGKGKEDDDGLFFRLCCHPVLLLLEATVACLVKCYLMHFHVQDVFHIVLHSKWCLMGNLLVLWLPFL
jgi:hypothetical protein